MSADLAAEIAAHRPLHTDRDATCYECYEDWPCLVARLDAAFGREVGRLTVAVADRDCELQSLRGALWRAVLLALMARHDEGDGEATT